MELLCTSLTALLSSSSVGALPCQELFASIKDTPLPLIVFATTNLGLPVTSDSEPPAGYVQRGNYYVRLKGSKFNELPLRDFLAKRQGAKGYTVGTWKSAIKFLPLRNIVAANSRESDFIAYYENAPSNDKYLA